MSKNKLFGLSAITLTAALVLSGCAASDEAAEETATEDSSSQSVEDQIQTEGDDELTGSIVVDGSSTVGPASEVGAELFMQAFPGVRVSVNISGTGGGFEKFCNGETDGSNASRPIKDEEAERCEENGIAYDFITVANDALGVIVHLDNPLECISVDALNEIWNADAVDNGIASWSDVSNITDLPAELAGQDLTLFGPGSDSGTFDYFTDEINGESGNIRNDYNNFGEDDLEGIYGVRDAVNGMAFVPYSYVNQHLDEVKPLSVDGGAGCVEPTIENVQNQSYVPLGRGLFTYASSTALARPETVEFFKFLINETDLINDTAGYVGLTAEQQTEQLARIDALING